MRKNIFYFSFIALFLFTTHSSHGELTSISREREKKLMSSLKSRELQTAIAIMKDLDEADLKKLFHENKVSRLFDRNYCTLLFWASTHGYFEIAKLLIEQEALIEDQDYCQRTPLYMAAAGGHIEMVKLLLKHHAQINTQNNYGHTPLYIATYMGHPPVVKYLIKQGANLNLGPRYAPGTPLDCARERKGKLYCCDKNHVTIEKLLEDAGAKTIKE